MRSVDPTRRRVLLGIGGIAAVAAAAGISVIRTPVDASRRSLTQAGDPAQAAASSSTTSPTLRPSTTSPAAVSSPTTVPSQVVEVICRDAWGAEEAQSSMRPHVIERLTLHHTAAPLGDNRDAPARARHHQRFHLDSGFADIAYHFIVDLRGNILEGRPIEYVGETFTDYDPTGHLLVCCEGDFNDQGTTEAQLLSVARVFAWGCVTFDVSPSTLAGHRDYASTSCPGDELYSAISDGSLRRSIADVVATGVVFTDVCGSAGERRVHMIESGEA